MQVNVIRVAQRDLKFATSKRMLVRVMKLLHVVPAKLEQFHQPKDKEGKWTWLLISDSSDPKRKVPIYFTVDQDTLVSYLSVTRNSKREIAKWEVKLPTELKDTSSEELLNALGF